MRWDLASALQQAANCIYELCEEICKHEGIPFDRNQDGDAESPHCFERIQPLLYAHDLQMFVKHIRETKAGKHTVEEFAEFYCLKEKASCLNESN